MPGSRRCVLASSDPCCLLTLQSQLCHFHSALLQSGLKPWPSPAAFFRRNLWVSPARWSLRPQPLWKKALSATAVGVPLLLGVRYFMAEPQEKRRMRLVVDGVGRFSRHPCAARWGSRASQGPHGHSAEEPSLLATASTDP
uniref:AarF domain containing kinase 5 n=1 Tax=Equus caballus TaxID=9796 RepID=A0A9L0TIP2_HORSE